MFKVIRPDLLQHPTPKWSPVVRFEETTTATTSFLSTPDFDVPTVGRGLSASNRCESVSRGSSLARRSSPWSLWTLVGM